MPQPLKATPQSQGAFIERIQSCRILHGISRDQYVIKKSHRYWKTDKYVLVISMTSYFKVEIYIYLT
jgi:hypothetical protein